MDISEMRRQNDVINKKLGLSESGYSAHIVFTLEKDYPINGLDEPLGLDIQGYKCKLVKHTSNIVILRITGIDSVAKAEELTKSVISYILWSLISEDSVLGIKYKCKILKGLEVELTATADIQVETNRFVGLCKQIDSKIVSTQIGNITQSPGIQLALEHYRLSRFDESPQAKFLLLTTILEILAPEQDYPAEVQDKVQEWIAEANNLANDETPIGMAYRSIAGSLTWNLKKSISQRISDFVYEKLLETEGEEEGEERALAAARDAKRVYNKRSQITHGNTYNEFEEDLRTLTDLVRKLLLRCIEG